MPYTKEQLENNEYFQNLKLDNIREYEEERQLSIAEFEASSSLDDNNQVMRLNNIPTAPIQSYENPETGAADNSPTTWVKLSRKQTKLVRGEKLNEIINREFEEL